MSAPGMPSRSELSEPEDSANAVIFLLSGKARFITGQTLMVNGGRGFY